MEFERKRSDNFQLNIAPLVDVVFLLLLFFMLTSHIIEEPVVKIKLPGSKTAANETEAIKTITITNQRRQRGRTDESRRYYKTFGDK